MKDVVNRGVPEMTSSEKTEMEENLRSELAEAERRLDEAASLEAELRHLLHNHGRGSAGMLADAQLFRAEARIRYRLALKTFSHFVMGR
jgi:hypothetical protein